MARPPLTVEVSPTTVALGVHEDVQFYAVAQDEFGNTVTGRFDWAVSEGAKETAAWADDNRIGDDWEKAAVHYPRTYPDRVKSWMPSANWTKLKEALDAA